LEFFENDGQLASGVRSPQTPTSRVYSMSNTLKFWPK